MFFRAKLVFTPGIAVASLVVVLSAGPVAAQGDNYIMMGPQQNAISSLAGSGPAGRGYSAEQLFQMGLAALAAGKVHEAERDFDHAVNADKTNANALTMRGVARERGGNLDGAVLDFEKSLKMDPTQITALKEYGVTLAKQGKADKAKAQLGLLKLQSKGCADACPDAARLKEAVGAIEEALNQPKA